MSKVDILAGHPKPPRKPLTPYMRYSKAIWQTVKEQNSQLSVCEIGATIGKMWRELNDEQKQKYNEDFTKEKAKYDEELAAYLKMTGLQASDLSKSKRKKGGESKANNGPSAAQAQHQQAMMGMQATQMAMHHMPPPGYPGNTAMMAPPGFNPSSTAAGALPHFSQIWASSPYDQSMQMNLMALSQQGLLPQNGHQVAQWQQQVVQAQQQVVAAQQAAAQQAPAQQQAAAQQQELNRMSPMYQAVNGSPQVPAAATSPHLNNASPLSAPSAATPEHQHPVAFDVNGAVVSSAGQSAADPVTTWAWHQPPGHVFDQQAQQQPQQQPRQVPQAQPQGNGILGQSYPEAQSGSPAGRSGSRPPSVNTESHKIEDPSPASAGEREKDQASPASQRAAASTPEQQTNATATSLPQYPSAHTVYNSYAQFNHGQWSSFPGGTTGANTDTTSPAPQDTKPQPQAPAMSNAFPKERLLEAELAHLRNALSEKTKEVQHLSQQLEKAYQIIEQMKQDKGHA